MGLTSLQNIGNLSLDIKSKSQNMCNLKIQQNKLSRQKAYEILIIKNDETTTDISWKHDAIKGEYKSKDIQLKEAMRSSVDEQILDFRRKNEIKSCEICGNIENLDVDHNDEKNSAFAELVSNFPTADSAMPAIEANFE